MRKFKKILQVSFDQSGFAPLVILIIVGLILAVVVYFGLDKFNNMNFFKYSPSPAPAVLQTNTNSAKQQMYEQNKEKIKADLHLTEEQFQVLKRYSGD